jgi:hypothetical protein
LHQLPPAYDVLGFLTKTKQKTFNWRFGNITLIGLFAKANYCFKSSVGDF